MMHELTAIAKEMEGLLAYDNPKTAIVIAAGLLADALELVASDNDQIKAILDSYRKLDNGRVVK